MKLSGFFLLISVVAAMAIISCDRQKEVSDKAPAKVLTVSEKSMSRDLAKENDTVWVIINHVRPDKREVFENFAHNIFFDSATRLSAEEQHVFRQTRILHPVQPEADGTYSYFFIMDPRLSGQDYGIQTILGRMYDKTDAERFMGLYREAVIKQTRYTLIQSRH